MHALICLDASYKNYMAVKTNFVSVCFIENIHYNCLLLLLHLNSIFLIARERTNNIGSSQRNCIRLQGCSDHGSELVCADMLCYNFFISFCVFFQSFSAKINVCQLEKNRNRKKLEFETSTT